MQRSSQGMHRVWFFSAVEPINKSADVETDEQREDRLQLAHDRGIDNNYGAETDQHSSVNASSVRAVCSHSGSPHNVLHGTRDITERDRKQKFRPNQNLLRDITSRWLMRITVHSSDS